MNIKISADSTCDLSPELIARYDIGISPLYIVRDGESLVDGVDITPDEIYAHVEKGGSTTGGSTTGGETTGGETSGDQTGNTGGSESGDSNMG